MSFDPEPPTAALRLLQAPNVVLSARAGSVAPGDAADTKIATRRRLGACERFRLDGEPPADVVS